MDQSSMIEAHIIDARGVYLRTEQCEDTAPQPPGAVYDALPAKKAGKTRMWLGGVWQQVPNADVPPLPGPAAEPVPARCTRRQGQLVLLSDGMLEAAKAVIAAIPDDMERAAAQIEYDADTWERSNAFLSQLWTQLGGTPESLDDAFRRAVTL